MVMLKEPRDPIDVFTASFHLAQPPRLHGLNKSCGKDSTHHRSQHSIGCSRIHHAGCIPEQEVTRSGRFAEDSPRIVDARAAGRATQLHPRRPPVSQRRKPIPTIITLAEQGLPVEIGWRVIDPAKLQSLFRFGPVRLQLQLFSHPSPTAGGIENEPRLMVAIIGANSCNSFPLNQEFVEASRFDDSSSKLRDSVTE